jgi:3'(2'), 5'-bisphosphate nucleotidase
MYVSERTESLIAVQSKSHSSEEEEEFFQDYDVADRTGAGSSLKFCRVAEGEADIYYRGGQTMEWDTAAGQAIVEAAGGAVLTTDGERLTYRKQGFANLPFVCTNGKLQV